MAIIAKSNKIRCHTDERRLPPAEHSTHPAHTGAVRYPPIFTQKGRFSMERTRTRSLLTRLLSGVSALATAAALMPQMPVLKAAAATTYDLKIDGTAVTDDNKSDIKGDGVFSYNPSTYTLTVSGDYAASSNNLIYCGNAIANLKIYVASDSVLTETGAYHAISLYNATATISGDGRLTVNQESSSSGYSAIRSSGDLTIRNADLELYAKQGVNANNLSVIGIYPS